MIDINNVRAEIDAIDRQLVDLFLKRLEIVGQVAASKRERGAPVYDPAREREILARVTQAVGPEYENGARLFFSTLFSISKARQRALLHGDSPLVRRVRDAVRAEGAVEDGGTPFPTAFRISYAGRSAGAAAPG